ncbi:replicative DNA helicase [Mucilaginibacter pallidiroseus]|uniref:Replicative DNA helicase n=1 Tax=Mucilaginibacter pallidiroseus TaxID=2599295 RepID=A0A563UIY8_9SPHI|nr:replicative DNA helicase [Mucilaginibacter pallidiroseus]TWR31354.1 replicative DNA helicase [Mucilaginibacter pallidiroseus]
MMFENDSPNYKAGTNDRRSRFTAPQQYMGNGKLQPQAVDLEEAILGALMLEKDALSSVIDVLKPEVFYEEKHKRIFQAIHTLFEKTSPVDILTVTAQLRQQGELELIGGAYYITELTNRVASAANIEYHARIVIQKFIQRELIRISTDVISNAYEDTSDVFDLLDKAEKNLFEIAQNNLRRDSRKMDDLMHEALRDIEALKDKKDGLTGVPSGFTDLDRITSGWQKSDLVIIAARPAMGKTAFVLSCARNAAVDFDKPVVVFSLEMSSVQLVNRLISGETEIEQEKIRKGTLEEWEWQQIHSKVGRLEQAPLILDDTPSLNIFEFRAKCRRLKSQYDIQLIIIDYLQLMHGKADGKGGNREQEIGSISRALKTVAKELNVPVIALSQLSRAVESRPGGSKRPMLSDLRESGSIEQDADMVLFLYRPEYYGLDVDEDNNPTQGVGEVIIAKHRNGETGRVRLKFVGKYVKFQDLEQSIDGFEGANPFAGLAPSQDYDKPNNFIIRPSRMDDLEDEPPF